jgi:hypothetical protein
MPALYDVHIGLRAPIPGPWRRFLMRADRTTFADLHRNIQDACGWDDRHLFEFRQHFDRHGGILAGNASPEGPGPETPLKSALPAQLPFAFTYVYDMGDEWEHSVVIFQKVEGPAGIYRELLDGNGAFPPEDIGGLPVFLDLLDALHAAQGKVEDIGDEDLREIAARWSSTFDLKIAAYGFRAARKPGAKWRREPAEPGDGEG